jgi:hypothetical protein
VAPAFAIQGTVYDSLRMRLYDATPPRIEYFSGDRERVLRRMESSGRADLVEQAQNIRDRAKELWRTKRDIELAGADELMVRKYATAVAIARRYDVRSQEVEHALRRLAYFTDVLGDATMRAYVTRIKDPTDPAKARALTYRDGMYAQSRSGLLAPPSPNDEVRTLPAP